MKGQCRRCGLEISVDRQTQRVTWDLNEQVHRCHLRCGRSGPVPGPEADCPDLLAAVDAALHAREAMDDDTARPGS